MKASLLDVGLILLIVMGTAGAEGPARLVQTLQAQSIETSQPAPQYTPIPAPRKKPLSDDGVNGLNTSSTKMAQQINFDSLPAMPKKSAANVRSEFIPAESSTNTPAKLVAAPVPNGAPSYEYTVPPDAPYLPSAPAQAPTLSGAPSSGSIALPAPSASVRVPATVYGGPEPSYAYKPLVPVVSPPATIHLGRGILGQPTVYVPGQPVRNFFRYFSP